MSEQHDDIRSLPSSPDLPDEVVNLGPPAQVRALVHRLIESAYEQGWMDRNQEIDPDNPEYWQASVKAAKDATRTASQLYGILDRLLLRQMAHDAQQAGVWSRGQNGSYTTTISEIARFKTCGQFPGPNGISTIPENLLSRSRLVKNQTDPTGVQVWVIKDPQMTLIVLDK